jgi:hypothetical protein
MESRLLSDGTRQRYDHARPAGFRQSRRQVHLARNGRRCANGHGSFEKESDESVSAVQIEFRQGHPSLHSAKPYPAKKVRAYLNQVIGDCGYTNGNGGIVNKQIEVFPKQDKVEADGIGSAIGLPFAQKSFTLDPESFENSDQISLTRCGQPVTQGAPQPDVDPFISAGGDHADKKVRWFEAILAKIGDGPGLDGFDEPLYRAAASYVASFFEVMDEDKLKDLLKKAIREAPEGPDRPDSDIKKYLSEPWLNGIIKPAIRKFAKKQGVTKEQFLAYLPTDNKYIFLPTGAFWGKESVNYSLRPIPILNDDGSPKMVPEGKDNKKAPMTMIPSAWLARYRKVECMTWWPGYPSIVKDKIIVEQTGWDDYENMSTYNAYKPSRLDLSGLSGDAAAAQPRIDHVKRIYPNDAGHIIKFFAHRVQHPGDKINHALFLAGFQGIGKDTMIEPVKRAIGSWNFQEVGPTDIVGEKYNDYMRSVILRVSEARDLGDVKRFTFYEKLKTMVTSPPDVVRIGAKWVSAHSIANVTAVVVMSNHGTDGIYIPADDRRFYVASSSLKKEDFTEQYWKDLWGWYDNGGDKAVAAYLQNFDLSDFNPKAPPPKTDAWWAIVAASSSSEDGELAELFDKLGNPGAIILEELRDEARHEGLTDFANWLSDPKSRRALPSKLAEMGYNFFSNPSNKKKGTWRIKSKERRIYARTLRTTKDGREELIPRREQEAAVKALIRELEDQPDL